MPKIILGRWKAKLVHDYRMYAFCEWSFDDGLFSVFLTEDSCKFDKELVAVCRQVCCVPAVMRAVLETRLGAAGTDEWIHSERLKTASLPSRRDDVGDTAPVRSKGGVNS